MVSAVNQHPDTHGCIPLVPKAGAGGLQPLPLARASLPGAEPRPAAPETGWRFRYPRSDQGVGGSRPASGWPGLNAAGPGRYAPASTSPFCAKDPMCRGSTLPGLPTLTPPPDFPGPATIAREACSSREHGRQTPPAQARLRAVAGLVAPSPDLLLRVQVALNRSPP